MLNIISYVLSKLSIPYGYTLTIWSAGALAAWKYKKPQPKDAFFFLFGAILAYILFGLLILLEHTPFTNNIAESHIAIMNISAIIAALAVAFITKEIKNKELGYFCTAFFATFVYIVVLVVEFGIFT